LQDVGFVPNYSNDTTDTNFKDFNNLGLQVVSMFTMLILLESLKKNAEDLYNSTINNQRTDTIMHETNPIYAEIKKAGIDLHLQVPRDDSPRFSELPLILPYDNFYHVICCIKVQLKIKNVNVRLT
jgi:hypothetical protein